MDSKKQTNRLINAIGTVAESSLVFYRAAIGAGATEGEATRLLQAYIAAMPFGKGAAGAEHDGPAKGGPADMTLDEIIRNLEDQVKDRESSIDEDDPDCIFRRDAEALREAVGLLSELAEYRKTGLSAADIQEAANLLNNTIHGDLPAELKSWVERCTWHVIIPASTSKIRRTPNERTENLRASQIWENPHHHRGW